MANVTPIFRLPYLKQGETLTGIVERTRFLTIDKQLESLYAFLGNGIVAGWEIIETLGVPLSVTITPGSAVVAGIAVKSSDNTILNNLVPGDTSGNRVNYVYAKILGHSPYTASVDFVTSTIFYDSETYLKLGRVIVDKNKNIKQIDMSEASGRTELTFLNFVLSLIKDHLHTGAPGDPSKIDLQEHVKGVLDSSFIGNIPASKITGGTISPERFKLSHNDLDDIGTLTHPELDSLVEKLQNINRILFGDLMTANLMQLYLSFKHVWPEVDQFTQNFITLIPGIGNNQLLNDKTYIDINATTAEVDYVNHRIRGKSLAAREAGQVTIRSRSDWENSDFDDNFIRIIDTGLAYGYGYGYGAGLDFFDVFETNDFNFLEGTDNFIAFPGSTYGYGTYDFETNYANSYSYGYGFEYATGFPETLTTTIVTLQPQTQTTEIHNKKIIDTPQVGDGNTYISSDSVSSNFAILRENLPSTSKADFVRKVGQVATTLSGKRTNTIDQANDGVNNIADDLYSFYSFVLLEGQGQFTDSDRAATYIFWTKSVDLTINNVITFRVAQTDGTPYDENWTFDHSFQLILEFSTATHRFYYLFKSGNTSDKFFIGDEWVGTGGFPTVSGTKYFQDLGEVINNRGRFELTAQIDSESDIGYTGNVGFIGGFRISDGSPSTISDIPIYTTLIKNLTGVMLYTDTTFGHNNKQVDNLGATYIQWPQGRRSRLEQPSGYTPNTHMLADIDKIFIGGPFGFNDKDINNDIQDLIISFPDRVDFTSISWISEEPGDSIVYIQINRLEEDSPTIYKTDPIWTNNAVRGEDEFNGATFYPSGSILPTKFTNIRGLRLRVVLLPTTDRRVAPAINSITVNYLSNTLSNQIVITTQDQWEDAREVRNLTVSGAGTVTITDSGQQFGKVRNVIYGTNRSVVETSDNFTTTVKRYGGSNLPTTVLQSINGRSPGLSGFVTDLKKLNNGNLAVLDRDEGRIIILNQNYELQQIIASENAFKTSSDVGAGSAGDVAVLVKAIYNRELGDNGILYLVFSHQLKAWPNINSAPDNITTSQIFIKSKGQTLDLSSIPKSDDNIVACDKGILSFKLTSTISNFIESSDNPIVQIFLNATTPGVKFLTGTTPQSGRTDLPITKIGTKGIFTGYNLIYAPIRGTVAFDIDDRDRLMVLKRTDVYEDGLWYARFSMDRFWTSWSVSNTPGPTIDPQIETNANTINGTETHTSLTSPDFFINNYFGYKGSIQRYEDFLLFTFCGDRIVWVTKKDANDGTKFRQPTEVSLPSDGTTPMGARFDPETTTSEDYTFVYVALSDLRRGSTNNSGKSKVVKIRDGAVDSQIIEWKYGAGEDVGEATRVISCNDVRPLVYTVDGVVVST